MQPSNYNDSPVIAKFKAALLASESFKMLYKKIKEGLVTKSHEEYEKIIESLSKMSGLTKDDAEECIRRLSSFKVPFNNDRFCNSYIKKSHSSVESIEENIQSQASLNHSLSLVNVGLAGAYSR